jgi:hypothetical protein
MVKDFFLDVMNVSGEMTFNGWRCLNCGDIIDPVIARHRDTNRHEVARPKRRWSGLRPRVFYHVMKDASD